MQALKKREEVEDDEVTQASQESEIEEQPFAEIDQLQNFGINAGDINKLKAHGLCTVLGCI